jgi:hypothetical protein
VFHYDDARDPVNGYPLAPSGEWKLDGLCEPLGLAAELGRLHFPVGGKRFRPCLEDVIEMLVVERFVWGRDGWSD